MSIPKQKGALIQFLRKYLLGQAPGHEPPTVALQTGGKLYFNAQGGDQYMRGTGGWLTIESDDRLYIYADQTTYIQTGDLEVVAGDLTLGDGNLALPTSAYLYFNTQGGDQYMRGTGGWLTIEADDRLYIYADQTTYIQTGDLEVVAGNLTVGGTANSIAQQVWTPVSAYGTGFTYDFAQYWENYAGSTYQDAGFMKDSMGFIHLRGLVQSTDATAGTTIFTLPAGYRPAYRRGFSAPASNDNDDPGRVDVLADGSVVAQAGGAANAGWIFLDGIIFDTR